MELPKGLKQRWEKKLPPCPKCGGRLAYKVSMGDETFAALIYCCAKDICKYATLPVRLFLKKVQGETEEKHKQREKRAYAAVSSLLANEVETAWYLKKQRQKEEEANVGDTEENFQEKPRQSGVRGLSDEKPLYRRNPD